MDMSGDVSAFRIALGKRIAEVVSKYATKAAAAETAGVTVEQLNKWIAGTVKVPLEALWRLAEGSNIDLSWLCVGQRNVVSIRLPRERPFQEPVLRDVLMALAEVIGSEGVTFQPDHFPGIVFDLHDYVCDRRAKGADDADLGGITHFISLGMRAQRSQ
ncbi:helix-turn-helix transcriptional regulator (plasmid) [Azospirillum sp. HJ39]|uniref:helix-turn-helix domain-containing protein n=1 Tax=Azospirillum sp. HJ39 TaxID=3159496 RepID=UPI003555FFAA